MKLEEQEEDFGGKGWMWGSDVVKIGETVQDTLRDN